MDQIKRKNKIMFYVLITLTFVISVADNLLTFIGSPDLSKEANPLVHTLGFSWAGLLVSNLVLFALDVFLAYYLFIKYEPKPVVCKNKKEYVSMMLFQRPDKYMWTWYRMPNNKDGYRFTLACFSFMMVFITPVLRLKAVIEWCVYLLNPALFERYCEMLGKVGTTTIWGRGDMIIQIVVMAIIFVFVFFHREYKRNQKLINIVD